MVTIFQVTRGRDFFGRSGSEHEETLDYRSSLELNSRTKSVRVSDKIAFSEIVIQHDEAQVASGERFIPMIENKKHNPFTLTGRVEFYRKDLSRIEKIERARWIGSAHRQLSWSSHPEQNNFIAPLYL